LAKDPVCGMLVKESPDALKAEVGGTRYYFCSEACRLEFLAPQKELARLRRLVGIGAVLTALVLALTYIPLQSTYTGYALLILAIPIQFVVGSRFYRGAFHALRAKTSNMDVLVAVGTSAAFGYSAVAVLFPTFFGSSEVYFDAGAVIITLVLAILIWRSWPSSTEWVIGTLVGISIFFSGVTRLMISLAARRVVTKVA